MLNVSDLGESVLALINAAESQGCILNEELIRTDGNSSLIPISDPSTRRYDYEIYFEGGRISGSKKTNKIIEQPVRFISIVEINYDQNIPYDARAITTKKGIANIPFKFQSRGNDYQTEIAYLTWLGIEFSRWFGMSPDNNILDWAADPETYFNRLIRDQDLDDGLQAEVSGEYDKLYMNKGFLRYRPTINLHLPTHIEINPDDHTWKMHEPADNTYKQPLTGERDGILTPEKIHVNLFDDEFSQGNWDHNLSIAVPGREFLELKFPVELGESIVKSLVNQMYSHEWHRTFLEAGLFIPRVKSYQR